MSWYGLEVLTRGFADDRAPVIISGPVSDGGSGVYIVVSTSLRSGEDENERNQSRSWYGAVHISSDGTMEPLQPILPEGFSVTRLGYSATGEVLVVGTHRATEGFNMSQLFAVDPTTLQSRYLLGRPPQYSFRVGESYYYAPDDVVTASTYPLDFAYDPQVSFLLLSDGRVGVLASGGLSLFGDSGAVSRVLREGMPLGPISNDVLAGEWFSVDPTTSWTFADARPLADGGLLVQTSFDLVSPANLTAVSEISGAPPGSAAQSILDQPALERMGDSGGLLNYVYATVRLDAAAVAGEVQGRAGIVAVSGRQATCSPDDADSVLCMSIDDPPTGTDPRAVFYQSTNVP